MNLMNKVALITGAGRGIGADTAKLFAKLGASLSLLSTTEESLSKVASECEQLSDGQQKPLVIVGSVADPEVCRKAVDDTIKKFGKLDILVNNAGISKLTFLLTSPIEDYDDIFNVNVRSVIVMTKCAAPHLIKSKGSIINVSSVGATKAAPSRMYYGMSKACINHFTRYIAQELGQYQVRVNTISPGYVKTHFPVRNYGITEDNVEEYYDCVNNKQILQRCAEGSEIANAIAFLVSNETSFVTGTEFVIDGGYLQHVPVQS